MKKKSLGIIGFGRFGQLVAKNLKDHFTIFASNRTDKRKEAKRVGVAYTGIKECAGKDIVVLCVPISSFEDVLEQIAPFLKRGALVVDVCSVKERPVRAMKKLVPEKCECIGTHPLFGPDTAKNSIKGKSIVLCPVRTKKTENIIKFLENLGLEVTMVTPKEHDKQMAKSLALIHLFGKALLEVGIEDIELTTPTHDKLMDLVKIVRNDTEQLFEDMHIYNRFTPGIRKSLIEKLAEINDNLNAKKK
ncbi:MAG: prephenate dehydrogenase/arogenate dehydrogenase family protein [Candidatus Methanofastidiosia archaeon]